MLCEIPKLMVALPDVANDEDAKRPKSPEIILCPALARIGTELAISFAERTGTDVARAEFIVRATLTQQMDLMAMGLFQKLVDHHNIGKTFNNMHWFTIETDPEGPEFFTSDQPLIIGPGLANPNAYVCLPLGPHRLFWAVRDPAGERQIRHREMTGMISLINEISVMQAHERSYATSDRHLSFMQKSLALEPHVSWFARLSDKWAAASAQESSQ